MTDTSIYNSKSLDYKSPYGAVASGTTVQFTLRPARAEGFSRAVLVARYEFLNQAIEEIPLSWVGQEGGRDQFSCQLDTKDYLGLIWYSFRLERLDGKTLEIGEHQLTVYDGSVPIPSWFGEGLSYQIFPDRFHRLTTPEQTGQVGDRWVHGDWEAEPIWRPNHKGEVRNRDFLGGTLAGITEKLDYLQGLGVETLYFCPIFEGPENHRYGTGDYEKIDSMLGTLEDFTKLCEAAHSRNMKVMLDGVFNHQAFVSKYFNGDGSYPTIGAAQSKESPYYDWYNFSNWPSKYDSWWGIYSLPATNESHSDYMEYITGENGIVRQWLRAGADGWRLDVADELPDHFIQKLHAAARAENPEAVIIGEVWEDGTNKIAYGCRRRHLQGGYLDGLMNYPFRSGLLAWLLEGNAGFFKDSLETLRENYPPLAFAASMNAMGTHDTPRVLTLLGMGGGCGHQSKEWRSTRRLDDQEMVLAVKKLRLAALVLYAFVGSPTVYYGDEVGMEGFEDPFNRRGFPWGKENQALLAWFRYLGKCRKEMAPLRKGDLAYVKAEGAVLAFTRSYQGETVLCAANAGEIAQDIVLADGTVYALAPWEGVLVPVLCKEQGA